MERFAYAELAGGWVHRGSRSPLAGGAPRGRCRGDSAAGAAGWPAPGRSAPRSSCGHDLRALAASGTVSAFGIACLRPGRRGGACRPPWRLRRRAVEEVDTRQSTEAVYRELVDWAKARGATGGDRLSVGPSRFTGGGAGLFASRPLAEGGTVLSVPAERGLLERPGAAGRPEARLAAALLRERARGSASRVAAYVASLPPLGNPEAMPVNWPRGVRPRDLFAASPMAQLLSRLKMWQSADSVRELLAAGAAETEQEARWALAMVDSRSFSVDGKLALFPYLDITNQSCSPNCEFRDRSVERGLVELRACRPLSEGEEVTCDYDVAPGVHFLLHYGFVPHGNPREACFLDPPADALRSGGGGPPAELARVEALKQEGWWRGPWRPVLLRLPDNAMAGGCLLRLARLAALPTAEEVRDLGRAVLQNPRALGPELERRALEEALRWLRVAMERSDAEIARLRGPPPGAGSAAAPLREAAAQLLLSERGVLASAADTLRAGGGR
uniref:SET domain-containing protein n=1 Tax=Alexandrium monilatum TaxID=311494 RepID=A0A7S4SHL7_9DINO